MKRKLLCLFLAGSLSGFAQDLGKVLPQPVPKQVEPIENQDLPPRFTQEELDDLGLRLWAAPDETVLLPELKGVRIVGSPEAVDEDKVNEENPLVCEVGDPLVQEVLLSLMSAFTGKPASEESVERMVLAARLALAQIGYPFSIVYLPPQDVTDGFLHLVVVESRLGAVRVEGNRYFSDRTYLSRIKLESGQVLNADAVREGIDRINANAFRQAAAKFSSGEQPATVDLVLQANDRLPVRVFAGVNNIGTPSTTEERFVAGVNWGNAFGRADQMTLQWTSDFEAKYSRAVSGSYIADLPGAKSITLFGAFSEIESKTTPDFDQAGESWQVGFNVDVPLTSPAPRYTQSLQFGFDFKSSDNNLDFLQPPFIIPVVDNLTHIVQARAQYRGALQDAFGSTSFGVKITASPGGLTSENKDEAFDAARAGAKATYLYANLDLFRDTRLPRGWNWTVQIEFQQSSGNLLGSEAFSGGGFFSVRGYQEGEVFGDNGVLIRQELLLPALHPLRRIGTRDMFRAFLFSDYAQLWNQDPLEGESATDLFSIGAGFSYQLSRSLTAQFAYGWQLEDTGIGTPGNDQRAHFNLNLSF